MSVLNEELNKILSVMKIVSEQEDSNEQMNVNLKKPVEVLKYLRIYSKNIEKMLIEITNMATSQIIDFHLLESEKGKQTLKFLFKNPDNNYRMSF